MDDGYQQNDSCYAVRHVTRSKGRGLCAVRDIAVGECMGGPSLLVVGSQKQQNKGATVTASSSCHDPEPEIVEQRKGKAVDGSMNDDPIRRNQTLFRGARALVPPVLLESRRQTHCAICFRPCREKTTESSSSGSSLYPMLLCSEECRKTATRLGLYEEQNAIVRVLQQGRIPKLFPTALHVYRLLFYSFKGSKLRIKKVGIEEKKSVIALNNWEDVMDMVPQANDDRRVASNDNAQIHEQAVIFTVFMLAQAALDQWEGVMPNPHLIQQALSRVKANAFSVTTANRSNTNTTIDDGILGTALFESPAYLVNHSCKPNAIQAFELGNVGHFRTITRTSCPDPQALLFSVSSCFICNDHSIRKATTTLLVFLSVSWSW